MARIKPMWVKSRGIALCIIPKSGSTSFRDALMAGRFLTKAEVLDCDKRVAFMRSPLDRWSSAYSFFHFLHENNIKGQHEHEVPQSVTHNGYEAWVDFALEVAISEKPNMHWVRQAEIMGGVQTHVYRLNRANIDAHWGKYWPGIKPGHLNGLTEHLPITDYRVDEIKNYYSDDLTMYKNLAAV